MGKRWIWLLIVLAVLLLAFLFPRIMLLIMEKDIEKQVITYGTGTLLNFDAMTLGEKQSLLSDPDMTVIQEGVPARDTEELRSTLYRELQLLGECGAIPSSVYDSMWASLQEEEIKSCKAYDPNGKNLFYFYTLESNGSFIRLDHETGKILSMGAYTTGAPQLSDSSCEVHLRSWAEYFGMTVSDLVVTSLDGSPDPLGTYASCKLSGSANSSCYYSVSLDPTSNYWECGSILLPDSR